MLCCVMYLILTLHVFFVEGAVALAEFLAESRQIQQLDLRQNEVKVGGLMALCLALRINRSLACLDLDHILPQEQVGAAIILTDRNILMSWKATCVVLFQFCMFSNTISIYTIVQMDLTSINRTQTWCLLLASKKTRWWSFSWHNNHHCGLF